MMEMLKYPRTPHITGSRIQPGDEDVKAVAWEQLRGLELVVEEKLDGSNCGIRFEEGTGMVLQSRGHILGGGPRERQFDLLKRWASHHSGWLRERLSFRYVMYGEWLYARHTIPYDSLPHYFVEFDLLDRRSGEFLSTPRRREILEGGPVVSAPVLRVDGLASGFNEWIGRSTYSTRELMEGLYLKREEQGVVTGRYKFVRDSFRQAVEESGSHWMDRPIEPNRLREGVDLFA